MDGHQKERARLACAGIRVEPMGPEWGAYRRGADPVKAEKRDTIEEILEVARMMEANLPKPQAAGRRRRNYTIGGKVRQKRKAHNRRVAERMANPEIDVTVKFKVSNAAELDKVQKLIAGFSPDAPLLGVSQADDEPPPPTEADFKR